MRQTDDVEHRSSGSNCYLDDEGNALDGRGGTGEESCQPEGSDLEPEKARSQRHNSEHDPEERLPSRLYETLVKVPIVSAGLRRCPRICAFMLGVIIPLCLLIGFSFAFGSTLCKAEGPPEIAGNNEKLVNIYLANVTAEVVSNLTSVLPRVCYILYLNATLNRTIPINATISSVLNSTSLYNASADSLNDTDITEHFIHLLESVSRNQTQFELVHSLEIEIRSLDTALTPKLRSSPEVIIDATDFLIFMNTCGQSVKGNVDKLLRYSVNKTIQATESPLTFNWIRCYEGAEEGSYSNGGSLTPQQRSAEGQAMVFGTTWNADRKQIFSDYYNELLGQGVDLESAYTTASVQALANATGGTTCALNFPSAGWFWFTVQTTIGYGNMTVTTTFTKMLVYTIGLMSILFFGGILAMSGYIFSTSFDDFVNRNGMKLLSRHWFGCAFWCVLYYTWMILISYVTITWKAARLDLPFTWGEAYWFSYISTTTIGFGDLYLQPEGIVVSDVFIFAMLFLVGFTFASAFMGKLVQLVAAWFLQGRKGFVQTLLDKHVRWEDTFLPEEPNREESNQEERKP